MYVIEYDGRPAAFVDATTVAFADWICEQENYVIGRWVCCESVFVQEIAAGRLPGPYTERSAEHFARVALIPDAEFHELSYQDDCSLAGHFDVPIEQIALKRADRRGARR